MVLAAFETTAEDVVAAAEAHGQLLTLEEGQCLLDSLSRSDLEAVAMAALDADDLDEQTTFAQTKIASIINDRGGFCRCPLVASATP